MEPLLGAQGAAEEVGIDLGIQPCQPNVEEAASIETIPAEEVAAVDSQVEDEDGEAAFDDMDVKDNVDDPLVQ